MFDPDNLLRCDFCNGTVTKHFEQIKFRQLTDRGYFLSCRSPHRHLQPLQFKALE
jgi:hypothetical protein